MMLSVQPAALPQRVHIPLHVEEHKPQDVELAEVILQLIVRQTRG